MKLLLAMIRYELTLQVRSPRFRIAAIGYMVICALPSGLLYFVIRHYRTEQLGGASYLAQTLEIQPYITAILVVLVAGNRSSAGALVEAWSVLAASPMSNVGYVVRRWLALLALVLPLSMVPQAVSLAAALAAGNESFDPATWIGSWCLRILPLVIALTAYWLAWVTITGGDLGALIASFVGFPILISMANQGLLRFHLTLSGYLEWFGYRNLFYWIAWTLSGRHWASDSRFDPGYAATEAPFDLASAAAWFLPRGVLLAGMAALGLGLAVAFVRRTRRDLKPRPVPPDHQLRTFLKKLNRQRERSAPDGGLGLPERLVVVVGVAALGLGVTWWLDRQRHFQQLAAERYRAETECDYTPLPTSVRPTSWKLRGRLDRRGGVEVDLAGRIENRATAPLEVLAFSLHPGLTIEEVTVASHRVETVRAWDRLLLRLDPPFAAGEALDLAMRLSGVPANIDFHFGRRRRGLPFAMQYAGLMNARFPRDVADLTRSWTRRAVSPRRIRLRATDLGPVPRYTPWTLTRPGEGAGDEEWESDYGREVPLESARVVVDLELELEAPARWFLADSCGQASSNTTGRSLLRSSCRTSLTELLIAGGPMERLNGEDAESAGRVIFAALPSHREQAERQLSSLARVASLSDRAWPGMPGLDGVVAMEWPPEFHVDLRRGMDRWENRGSKLAGRLLLIPERQLIGARPLEPEDLVAKLLSQGLLERRAVAAEQEVLFRHLFRALMVRRMGLDDGRGATVSGKPWLRQALQTPILSARPGFGAIWRNRLPAVLVEIEGRLGGDNLYAGIESFLSAGGEEPGTIEELLANLESTYGVALQRTYEDHFRGSALPMLRLEDVRSSRQQDGWQVEGKVRNTGTGQSICPVIVKTEVSERKIMVTVDSESASSFTARTASRPHTVLLDPERTCYRFLLKTSPALERANLL